jgi:hypothetical protein
MENFFKGFRYEENLVLLEMGLNERYIEDISYMFNIVVERKELG